MSQMDNGFERYVSRFVCLEVFETGADNGVWPLI